MDPKIDKKYRNCLFNMIWNEFDRLERRITSAHIDALPSDALQSMHDGLHHRNKMIDQYVGYKMGLREEEVEAVFDKRDGIFTKKRGGEFITKEEKAFVGKPEKKPRKSTRPAKSQAAAKAKKKKSAKTSAVLSRKRK